MRKRISSIVLSVCLCFTLLPTAAFAEETSDPTTPTTTTNKTLMLGTSGIKSPTKNVGANEGEFYYTPNSYIYFGMNDTTPIKWRVLNADKANDGTTDGMFLLSEYLLAGNLQFVISHEYYNSNDELYERHKGEEPADGDHTKCKEVGDAIYQGSNVQIWCNTFTTYLSNFSTAEKNVMLGVEKTDTEEANLFSGYLWCGSELTADDKLFFLSVRELADYVGNYNEAPGLVATDTTTQSPGAWWLRSPAATQSDTTKRASAVVIQSTGDVRVNGSVVSKKRAARPAFNLNNANILFTSAAVDGKSGTLGEFSAITDYSGSEWKVTLKDDNRHFSVTETALGNVEIGDTVSLDYSGAVTGKNEYISVIMEDENGTPTHYGRMATVNSASGTVEVTLPSDLALQKTYTLKVFNEQYNGNYKTDYASDFQSVTFTAVDTTAPTLTAGTASRTSDTNAAVTFNSDEAGTYYYAVMDSGATAPSVDTTGAGTACIKGENTISLTTLTAGAKDIYIMAEDVAGNMMSDPLKIAIPAYVPPSSGGSSSNTTTTTKKNEDGSTTTTVTDKKTGTVTETTKNTDGSTTTIETRKDGTVTETNKTATGTTSTTVTDKNGNSTTTVSVSKKDAQNGETVTLPVDEVTAAGSSEDAQEITVEVPSSGATIEVPVKNPTPGTVIVIVDKNGNETVVPTTKQTENGVSVTLTEDATIKVIENSKDFSDVKDSDYFGKAVDWASSRGITGGNSATTFGPHDSCTRAQLVTFLWRAAGQPEAVNESGMSDVATNAYYTDAVAWAFENGIVGGYGNGQFGSDDTITREQMAVILYRFAQHTGMDTTQGGMSVREYKDFDSVSDYAVAAIQWAVNAGIMQGNDGNLMPGQPCTRAQIVTMLYRLLG